VLAKAGLRPGEAFALQLGDVDLQAQTLQVERAVNLGRIKPTKTYDCRTVDLTPELIRELHRHVLRLKEEALRRGWGEPVWLFPNDANHPYDKWKAGDAFRRTLKRAGLPHFRPYDLRHTYASLLLAAGAPITYVSAQLGHANRRRRSATTRSGSRVRGDGGSRCWTAPTGRPASKLEPESGTKRVRT
jgi:integrase